MNSGNLSTNDFIAAIRPIRNAFIIPFDLDQSFILENVIPWLSSHWGGAHQFFLPIFPEAEQHPTFKNWITLLTKFDPDHIISIGSFTNTLLDIIKESTLSTADHFQFSGSVPTPNMIHRSHYGMEMENVFSKSLRSLNLKEFSLTGNLNVDIWFFSQFGRFGNIISNVRCDNISISEHVMTEKEVLNSAKQISFGEFDNNFDSSPSHGSMSFLGGKTMNGFTTQYFLPYYIVLGDSPADWALYMSLKFLYNDVFWLKPNLLSVNNMEFEWVLYHILSSQNRNDPAVIVSATLNAKDIKNIIDKSLTAIKISIQNIRYQIQESFGDIRNWYEWVEINNSVESSLIFDEQRSVQRVPVASPKHFQPKPTEVKFFSVLYSDTYSYLSHPLASQNFTFWKTPGAVTDEDARRSQDGGITFNSVQHLIFNTQDMDSVQHGPKLIKTSIFEDLTSILSTFNL